jgi:hypothetical protein
MHAVEGMTVVLKCLSPDPIRPPQSGINTAQSHAGRFRDGVPRLSDVSRRSRLFYVDL